MNSAVFPEKESTLFRYFRAGVSGANAVLYNGQLPPKATLKIQRKPAELMKVDWVGDTPTVSDLVSGEAINAYLFMPCSLYSFSQTFPDIKF